MRFFQIVLCVCCVFASARVSAAQFWLAGRDPVQQEAAHIPVPADYMQLFSPAAPWLRGAAHLSVFKIFPLLVLRGPDDVLRTVFQDMHRRHVAIAIELGTLLEAGTSCGGGEGYTQPGMIDRLGRRLQSLRLSVDYVAMDEPLWFGHERYWGRTKAGRPDCQYSVALVAQRVASSLQALRSYFPGIRFGDIEVVSSRIDPAQVIADYTQFMQLLQSATGQKPAFFHVDIAWQDDWRPILAPLKIRMHALGIRFGVIAGGSPDDGSDEEWVNVGLQRLRDLESNPATRPDDVVIQSWQRFPTRMLPEITPGSTTYMLLQAEGLAP